jgi:hypothetical protein
MPEKLPDNSEKGPERIPTPEEVESVFKELVGENRYIDRRKLEDDQGLYLWEIVIEGEEDETTEYSYMRQGRHREGSALDTSICVVFFNEKGEAVGGHSVAKYVEGKWQMIP